jgi:hypothetical protein
MNPERVPRATRWTAALFAVAAACALLDPVASQEPGKQGKGDAPKGNDFQVVALKYARATEVARLLQETYAAKEAAVRIVADPATNQLVISAAAAQITEIRGLIAKIDVVSDNEAVRRLKVYELRSLEPDKALEDALRLVFSGSAGSAGGNFSLDRARKLVIVSADENTLRTVEALLVRLDERVADRPFEDVQVRVVWLASGPAREDNAPQPPDDLKEVLPGLAKLGIDRPRLVAQTLVNVTPNAEFQAKGVAKLDAPCRFTVTGRFSLKKEMPSLEISLAATRQREPDKAQEEVCNLQTEINAPLGHLVVLGVTPTDSATSVFVVQVLPRQTKKSGPPK